MEPSSDQIDLPDRRSQLQSQTDSRSALIKLVSMRATQARLIFTLAELRDRSEFPPFVFAAQTVLDHLYTIHLNHDNPAPVLLTGESGTGKELMSRTVHVLGPRKNQKFIAVNCAALSRELIESELFGHVKGAFTGATGGSQGIISKADGGTLFLDEIGELPLEVQPKLLRFLQEGEIKRVGADEPVKVDVRVIAATNRDPEEEVRAGRFRADLFYRLRGVWLHLPPLRERREEIPLFIVHFLECFRPGKPGRGPRLSDDVTRALLNYDWPGNVRELANEIRRLVMRFGNGEVIGIADLAPEIRIYADARTMPPAEIVEDYVKISRSLLYSEKQDEVQRLDIIEALTKTNGNQKQAAKMMKMSRNGFKKAAKRLRIDIEKYCQS